MSLVVNTDTESEIAWSLIVNTDPESDRELDEVRDALKALQDRQAVLTQQLAHDDTKINTMKGIIGTQAGEIINLKDALGMAEKRMELMRESKEKVVSLFHPKTENKASQANIEIVTAMAKEHATRTRTSKKVKNKLIQAPVIATDFSKTKITQTYNGRKQRGTQYKVGDTEVKQYKVGDTGGENCSDSEDFEELKICYIGAVQEFYDTDDGY
jgi:hypothetical protein